MGQTLDVDVNLNITVKVPAEEIEALKDELKWESDDETYEEEDLGYKLDEYLESNLDVTYHFGDAWICGVDGASVI